MTVQPTKGDRVASVHTGQHALLRSITAEGFSDALLVTALFASTFLDTVRLSVFGGLFNIRASFVVGAIVIPILAQRWLALRQPLQRTPLLPVILGLDGCFFLSTAINWQSPLLLRGFISCSLLLANIAFFGVVYWHAQRPLHAEHLLRVVVAIAAVYALIGIIALLLYQLGFGPARYLVEFRTLGNWTMGSGAQDALAPRPWFLEPNIGSYMGAIGVMAMAKSLIIPNRARWFYGVSTSVIFTGVLLTYSRGAWLGAIVGGAAAVVLVIISRGLISIRPLTVAVVAATLGAAALVFLTAVPSVKTVLVARMENILNFGQGTGSQRLAFWAKITKDALNRPILGHGANAYQLLLPSPTCPPPCGPYVAENAVVEIFHTSGVVGLAIYMAVTIMVVLLFWRAFATRDRPLAMRAAAIPAISGYLSLLVASQLNPSFWGNMYWAIFGLAVALLAPMAIDDRPPAQPLVAG